MDPDALLPGVELAGQGSNVAAEPEEDSPAILGRNDCFD